MLATERNNARDAVLSLLTYLLRIEPNLPVDLAAEAAVGGGAKAIGLLRACRTCLGTGRDPASDNTNWLTCTSCNGSGRRNNAPGA